MSEYFDKKLFPDLLQYRFFSELREIISKMAAIRHEHAELFSEFKEDQKKFAELNEKIKEIVEGKYFSAENLDKIWKEHKVQLDELMSQQKQLREKIKSNAVSAEEKMKAARELDLKAESCLRILDDILSDLALSQVGEDKIQN